MLQRSPGYMLSRPSADPVARGLQRIAGARAGHAIARWKNLLLAMYVFRLCRRRPQAARSMMIKLVRRQLGPDYDVDTHFTPRYNPWEQRLCLVPDGDLFKAIRAGRVDIVTDRIVPLAPWTDFSSGYFQRALDMLPRQGAARPWKLNQNYLADLLSLRFAALEDGVLRFTG
jgi:cation diffusion facilitator CzcD-associated flavoprotein CzcO